MTAPCDSVTLPILVNIERHSIDFYSSPVGMRAMH
jgi:hypothetical protein